MFVTHDESKNAATSGRRQPGGTAQRIWSTHRGELRNGTASAAADYALAVQAAARDAVRHVVGGLGERYGPQFVQDVTAKLVVELAEATAAIAAQDGHEEFPADPD